MTVAAQELKQPDILKRKPNLKICSNHIRNLERHRIFIRGIAVRDGKGWYITKYEAERRAEHAQK